MQNDPSSPAYFYRTPPHAHYTHAGFLLGSPPFDHAAYLHPNYSASLSAPSLFGYPYPDSTIDLPPVYPHPYPTLHLHKNQSATWPSSHSASTLSTTPPPSMAITIPPTTTTTSSAPSGRSSRNSRDRSGSASDGPSDPNTPPPAASRQRENDVKKKIHPCWMCHKSFDRPSTLKKHLLVHTGEKAFACESCGRRFGVASNLNRHAKTCRAANTSATAPPASSSSGSPFASDDPNLAPPVATASPTNAANASTPRAQVAPADAPSASTTSTVPRRPSRKRKAADSEASSHPEQASEQRPPRSRKRARRAPSPALWIPDSLKAFDLTPMTKGTPVPLPPVRPFQDNNTYFVEERDSFDENASSTPYHPRGWTGRLPGPGLHGNNVANRNGGQLLIFS